MSSEQTLKKSYRLDANVELGKFTVVIQESTNFADGCAVPAAANAAGILGVAQNSIIPSGTADYSAALTEITRRNPELWRRVSAEVSERTNLGAREDEQD